MSFKHLPGFCGIFLLLALQTHSAPISISQITGNFPSVDAIFEFDGTGNANKLTDYFESYTRVETDAIATQENALNGFGTISNSVSGASAFAESNNVSVLNRAEADRFPGAANSNSMTIAGSYYNVENVSTVSFTLDVETSMQLVTESSTEFAYGYLEESLGLFWFEDNQFTLLDEFQFFDEQGVTAGESYSATESSSLNVFYDFGTTPFTGQLLFEGVAMAYTDVVGQESTPVPEPGIISLLILGLGIVFCMRISGKQNAC